MNKNKNKNKNHLPLYGVGPVYVAVIITVTMAGILLSQFKIIVYLSFSMIKMVLLMIDLYGVEYEEYCRRVNRCIPWFPKNR